MLISCLVISLERWIVNCCCLDIGQYVIICIKHMILFVLDTIMIQFVLNVWYHCITRLIWFLLFIQLTSPLMRPPCSTFLATLKFSPVLFFFRDEKGREREKNFFSDWCVGNGPRLEPRTSSDMRKMWDSEKRREREREQSETGWERDIEIGREGERKINNGWIEDEPRLVSDVFFQGGYFLN